MTVYLLIDISASMTGAKIASVNDAMENLMDELKSPSFDMSQINVLALTYSRDVQLVSPQPVSPAEFQWPNPVPYGMTNMGKACAILAENLKEPGIVINLSDGYPTDDYEDGLNKLYENEAFINSEKLAIAIGEEADIDSLIRFSGNGSNVFSVNQIDDLSRVLSESIVKFIPRTVSSTNFDNNTSLDDEWD